MPNYLQLFHGRKNPFEVLEDWGAEGPIIGPLQYVHTTYATEIKFTFADTQQQQQDGWLTIHGEFVYYDGYYYGDWSVFSDVSDDLKPRLVSFDQEKAKITTAPEPLPINIKHLNELLQTIEEHRNDPNEVISANEYSEDPETLEGIEDQAFREELEHEASELINRLVNSALKVITTTNQAGHPQLPEILSAVYNYYNSARPQTIESMLGHYVRENIDNITSAVAPEADEYERNAIKLSMLFEADKMDPEAYNAPNA